MKQYGTDDVINSHLKYIPNNEFHSISPLYYPKKEHDNIMVEKSEKNLWNARYLFQKN